MTDGAAPQSPSLYLHIPFCRRKCRYCDFYSRPPAEGERDRFVPALLAELEMRALSGERFGTVYAGGGTPSFLGAERLAALLAGIGARVPVEPEAERTIEANPLDVTAAWADACRTAGWNRLSVGVQSVAAPDLAFLGRPHCAADGPRAVAAARAAGFENVGIDLMYGLPGQTTADVAERLRAAVAQCRPDHVSCYQLTYARGTPLYADLDAGRIARLGEAEEHALFLRVHEEMAALGFPAYEVSNFAPPDKRACHNAAYWRHRPYLGLGPSAHSFAPPVRRWNGSSVTAYLECVEQGRSPEAGRESLAPDQLAAEVVMLALRTTDGLDRKAFRSRFGFDAVERRRDAYARAESRRLLRISPTCVRPTLAGLAVADALAAELA